MDDPREILRILLLRLPDADVCHLVALAQALARTPRPEPDRKGDAVPPGRTRLPGEALR